MMLLLSGEGSSDMGSADKPGPMAILVDRFLEPQLGYSLMEYGMVQFLTESDLTARVKQRGRMRPQSLRLKGYAPFTRWAEALGTLAKERAEKHNTPVIAILFRDSDGTQSARADDPQRWQHQHAAMQTGFSTAGARGVPMHPKPKSEAWLLCALREEYKNCQKLEALPGNDDSPQAPKKLLEKALGELYNNDRMIEQIKDGKIDLSRIDMPSCIAFRKELTETVINTTKI